MGELPDVLWRLAFLLTVLPGWFVLAAGFGYAAFTFERHPRPSAIVLVTIAVGLLIDVTSTAASQASQYFFFDMGHYDPILWPLLSLGLSVVDGIGFIVVVVGLSLAAASGRPTPSLEDSPVISAILAYAVRSFLPLFFCIVPVIVASFTARRAPRTAIALVIGALLLALGLIVSVVFGTVMLATVGTVFSSWEVERAMWAFHSVFRALIYVLGHASLLYAALGGRSRPQLDPEEPLS